MLPRRAGGLREPSLPDARRPSAVRFCGAAGVLACAVVVFSGFAVEAQVPGLPMFTDPFRTNMASGKDLGVLLTIGHASDDGGEEGKFSFTAGLRRRLIERMTAQVTGGLYRPLAGGGERISKAQVGALLDYIVKTDPAALSVHGGIGYRGADDGSVTTFPLGLGISGQIPLTTFVPNNQSPGGPQLGFWALPRGELLRRSGAGASQTDPIWGVSFGLSIWISEGIGINSGWDYRDVPSTSPTASLPFVPDWSWALLLRLRV